MVDASRPLVLLLGGTGQVGSDLGPLLAEWTSVRAPRRAELELRDVRRVRDAVRDLRPGLIVNTAAMTNVDEAERDPEGASALNATLPRVLAEEAERSGAFLLHYSTDYVFDGRATRPYREDDEPAPVNRYGESKLLGELGIAAVGGRHLVVRTSWVYGARGKNFFSTVSRLAREREVIEVVTDQAGSPTWSGRVAEVTDRLLRQVLHEGHEPPGGIVHVAGGGVATRYEFAAAVVAEVPGTRARLVPVRSDHFPRAAARPAWSVLDTSLLATEYGILMPDWREEVQCLLQPPGGARAGSSG